MIEVVIFDLDDTLIDTSHLVLPLAVKRAFQSLIQAGAKTTYEELKHDRDILRKQHPHHEIFSILAKKYFANTKASPEIIELAIQKATKCFYEPELNAPFPLIEGAKENLDQIFRKKDMYLVTSGIPTAQKKKVFACQIEKYFKQCFYVESMQGQDKSAALSEILKKYPHKPSVFLSIGNRLSSEIRESKKLGMQTCYFQFGEHQDEEPASDHEHPDYVIHHHQELLTTCPIFQSPA
ncbi:MAG: HAD hydrolase-like protein [Pseudobdellovibrionaceae bacterium]